MMTKAAAKKMKLFHAAGLVVLVVMTMTARPADAQSIASGKNSDNPSWSLKLECDTESDCPRFVVLSKFDNAAVLDRETGLVWEQSPSPVTSGFIWSQAHVHCNRLSTGGRLGWRLPTVQELASLVDPSVAVGGFIPSGPFTNVHNTPVGYWTATTFSSSLVPAAWIVRFDSINFATGFRSQDDSIPVWCVRGGQGVDAQ